MSEALAALCSATELMTPIFYYQVYTKDVTLNIKIIIIYKNIISNATINLNILCDSTFYDNYSK